MPEQLIQKPSIYSFLKDNGLTSKSEQEFNTEYADSSKAKELYGFFTENQLTSKDFDTFYKDNFSGIQQSEPSNGKTYMENYLDERFPSPTKEEQKSTNPFAGRSITPEELSFGKTPLTGEKSKTIVSDPLTIDPINIFKDEMKTSGVVSAKQNDTGKYFEPAAENVGGAQIDSSGIVPLTEDQKEWANNNPKLNKLLSKPGMGIIKEAYIGTKKMIGQLGTSLDYLAEQMSGELTGGANIDKNGNITYPWEEGYKKNKSEFYNNVRKYEEETPQSSGGATAFIGQMIPQTAGLAATILARNPNVSKAYLASMYSTAFGSGIESYDDYMKETGQKENPTDRLLVGLGYGAAEYIGEKIGLDYFMPKGYGRLVAKSLDASPNTAKEIGKSVLENYAKITKQSAPALAGKLIAGSQIEGGQELFTEGIDIAIDEWITGKDVSGKEIRDRLVQSYAGGTFMGAGVAPFARISQNLATTQRRRQQGNVTISIDEDGLPVEIIQTENKIIGLRPDGSEVNNISRATLDKSITYKTEDFENAIARFNKAGTIQDLDIEPAQPTTQQPVQPISSITEEQPVSLTPRQAAEQEARTYATTVADKTDGIIKPVKLVTGMGEDNIDLFIGSVIEDPVKGTMYTLLDAEGNPRKDENGFQLTGIASGNNQNIIYDPANHLTIDQFVGEQLALFDQAGQQEAAKQAEEQEIVALASENKMKLPDGTIIERVGEDVWQDENYNPVKVPKEVVAIWENRVNKLLNPDAQQEVVDNTTETVQENTQSVTTPTSGDNKVSEVPAKPSYPVDKNGNPDIEQMDEVQLFNYNAENFGIETAVADLQGDIQLISDKIAKAEKKLATADTKTKIKTRIEIKNLTDQKAKLEGLIPQVAENNNSENQNQQNVSENQSQDIDSLVNTLFVPENNLQKNEELNTPAAETNGTSESEGEITAQEEQGQGVNEGLEENVNKIKAGNPESREELELRLQEERKQRILSKGTSFDREFNLIHPKDIKSADDVISNVNKIITTLKENEGNGKFRSFEGFASNGNYSKNAGDQIRGYFITLDVLPDELRNDMRKAFSDNLKINNVQELMDWAAKQYKQTASSVPPVVGESFTPGDSAGTIEQAATEVNTNPTEAQKEAGNYKKGHVKIQGMDITIENPKGSFRKGVDEDGRAWETEMKSHYGYFKRTNGKDGDHIDTFIGDNPESLSVFVVDQNNPKTGAFDESKVMLGYNTPEEAKAAYLSNYEPGWRGFGSITPVSIEDFKTWLYDGAKQRKPFAEYKDTPTPISEEQLAGQEKANAKKAKQKAKQISPEEQAQRKIDRAYALKIEPITIEQLILQYIVAGNRLNWDEIKREVFPRSDSEMKQRIWMLKKDAKTIDQLLGLLNGTPMEEEGNQPNVFRNAVIDAVLRNGTRTQMVDRILEIGDQNNFAKDFEKIMADAASAAELAEQEERNNELLAWEEYLTELENNGQLPTENELIELFLQDNTIPDEQAVNQAGSSEQDRPVNPEENEGNRQVVPGSKQGNDGRNAVAESQKELTPLEKEIQSLQKERAELLSKKIKTVKNVNARNGLFGDIAAKPGDLFEGQGFDATEAQHIVKTIDDRISVIDQTIEDLTAKNEQVKATAEKENAGQQEINLPDVSLESDQVQDVAGQDSGQRPAVKEPWQMTREEFKNAVLNGKLYKANGITPSKIKGSGKTPLSLGESEGYPSNDIAAFYVARRSNDDNLTKVDKDGVFKTLDKIDDEILDITREEYLSDALSEGKPVPEEVLNDYPELKKAEEEIPTSPDGLYQIYKVGVRNKDGGVDQYYGVPSVENKGVRGWGDGLHKTIDQALKEAESNRIEEQQNIKDREEREAQKQKEEAEKQAKIEANKGKSKLELMNEAKNEKVLNTKINIGGVIKTRKQHIEDVLSEGGKIGTSQVNKIKDVSRTTWNRMDGWQQEDFERRQKEAGFKTEYRLYTKDGSFYDITKAEYDYAQQILTPKPLLEVLSDGKKEVQEKKLDEQIEKLKSEIQKKVENARYLAGNKKGAWGLPTDADKKRSAEIEKLRENLANLENKKQSTPLPEEKPIVKSEKELFSLTLMSKNNVKNGFYLYQPIVKIGDKYYWGDSIKSDKVLNKSDVDVNNVNVGREIPKEFYEANGIKALPEEKQDSPYFQEEAPKNDQQKQQDSASSQKPLLDVLKEGKEVVDSKPKEVIEDFGEKIEGARKDQIKKYFDKINLNGKILSTIFPKPDIKALLESGLSVKDVAGIKVAHEFATQDKKKGEKVIKFYAAYAKNILAESINLEYTNKEYVFTEYGKSQIELRTKAYQDVHDKLGAEYLALDLTKVKIAEPDKSGRTTYFRDGEPIASGDVNYIVQYYVNTSKYFATLPEAIDYFTEQVKANTKIDQVVYKRKLNIYYDKRVKGEFYIGFPSKGDVIKLKDGFKTSREAFEALKNPEILSDLQTMLERILAENRQSGKPAVRLKYSNETARERVGKDWRNGKDIGSKELAETFGFRAIEFGNWVNQKERQVFVNNTYDSLMDLAQLLNISPKAISLAGNLGLTFGSRGSGKAAAHYEPGRKIINLTKTQGLGSLAHEWWHGVDNYFADFKTSISGMKSASAQEYSQDARDDIKKSFDELYKAVNNYSYKQRSKNLDGTKNVEYFSLPHEMSARAFENYMLNRLAQSGQVNDFIVNFISNEDWNGDANKYPYPKAEESVQINEAFQQLFDTIQEKEENDNVVMFRLASSSDMEENNLVAVHNIKPAGLLNANRLGGLPMPSIAIIDVNHGFNSYGEITLIADKDFIDPKKNKSAKVFASDVYSARYPNIAYQLPASGSKKLLTKIQSVLSKELTSSVAYNLENEIENRGFKDMLNSRYAKLLFLKDGEYGFDYAYTESKYPDPIKKAFVDNNWQNLEYFELNDKPEIKKQLTDLYISQYEDGSDKREIVKQRLLEKDGTLNSNLLRDFINGVRREIREAGKIDLTETLRSANNFIEKNKLEKEFEAYARDLYKSLDVTEKIFKGFNNAGNRIYSPHTLENVLKEMKKAGVRAGETSFYGAGSVRAQVTPEFKSLKEIQNNRGSIQEGFDKVKEEANSKLFEVLDAIRPFYKYDSSNFGYSQNAAEELVTLGRRGSSESFKPLTPELNQMVSDYLTKLSKLPTEYFEAKINRGVSLAEFNNALIPENTSPEIREILKFNDINAVEYKDNADRAAKLKQLANEKDLRFRLIGETGAGNLDKAEEATTRLDNLAIAREMEQAGKDVKSIRLATGWEKGVDGKWRYEVPDGKFNKVVQKMIDNQKANNIPETWGLSYPLSLNKIIDDPQMFIEYPELANVKVQVNVKSGNKNKGSYSSNLLDTELGKIDVQASDFENFKSVLIHEIQHAIQEIEGFAKGGNTNQFYTDKEFERRVQLTSDLIQKASDKLKKAKEKDEWLFSNAKLEDFIDDYNFSIPREDREYVTQWAKNLAKAPQSEIDEFLKESPLEKYRRLAGEVESRNVQTRMNMTPEERLNTLLSETEDVAREDQIVLMDGLGVSNLESDSQKLANDIDATFNYQSEIAITDREGAASMFEGILPDEVVNQIRNTEWEGGFSIRGKIVIHSGNKTPEGVLRVLVHEKAHIQIRKVIPLESARIKFFSDVYSRIDSNELKRVIGTDYDSDPEYIQAEEYYTHLVEELSIKGELPESVDSETKNHIFDILNGFTTIKNIQDVINTKIRNGSNGGRIQSNTRGKGNVAQRNTSQNKVDTGTSGALPESGSVFRKGQVNRPESLLEVLADGKRQVKEKKSQQNTSGVLTEKEFNKKYFGQHKDIRSGSKEKALETFRQIQETGFNSGAYIIPIYKGGDPTSITEKKYGPSKGDMIYLVPKEWIKTHRINPDTIKEGWKPADNELIEIEYDNQSAYEAYVNGLKNKSQSLPETITVNGVERPTRNSKGQFIHTTKEGIENFWKWFGNSKVTVNDRPLVVYHGSPEKFNEFNTDMSYFTPVQNTAFSYGVNTIPAYLSIKNPLDLTDLEKASKIFLEIDESAFDSNDEIVSPIQSMMFVRYAEDDVKKWALKNGYDGIILPTTKTIHSEKLSEKPAYIVFSPSQIKSATGNNGSFSPETNDIRYRFAFHGSPHSFDKFSLDKIGTGEGAQAYGWGLYFTDKKDIAKTYAGIGITVDKNKNYDYLAINDAEKWAKLNPTDFYSALMQAKQELEYAIKQGNPDIISIRKQTIEILEDSKDNKRNLYTVKIHGDKTLEELNFLRWDKPVTAEDQGKIFKQLREEKIYPSNAGSAQKFWSGKSSDWESGEMIYSLLEFTLGSQKAASEFLLRAGIDGIIYPAEYQTKGTHDEAFNYVVFDEKAVEIEDHVRFRKSTPLEEILKQGKQTVLENKANKLKDGAPLPESSNPEFNKLRKEARGLKSEKLLDRIKRNWDELKTMTQHFDHIKEKDYRSIYNKLRKLESVPEVVRKETYDKISQIVAPIINTPNLFDAFERYIILNDLMSDINKGLYEGKPLPFGFTSTEQVRQDAIAIKKYVNDNPVLKEAIAERNKFMKDVRNILIKEGLLKPESANTNEYFHHQVLKYSGNNPRRKNYPGLSISDARVKNIGAQKGRVGSAELYNTNYIESEFEVVAQTLEQLETKYLLRDIGNEADMFPEIFKQAQLNGMNWRMAIPEGFRIWYPKKGTTPYKAASAAEKAVMETITDPDAVEQVMEEVALENDNLWVIPEDLAAQLDAMKAREQENPIERGLSKLTALWKVNALFNPLRAAKYMLNNLVGDVDIVLAYDPKIFKYVPDAVRDLYRNGRGQSMSEDMREALHNRVIGSGITVQELQDVNNQGIFRLMQTNNFNVIRKYMETVTGANNFRENVLRLAAYKYFKDKVKKGEKVYGASKKQSIDAIEENEAKAGRLAADLMIDYGNISRAGDWFRRHTFPFWSWVELNAPRYYQMLKNVSYENDGKATGKVVGKVALKAGTQYAKYAVKIHLLYGLIKLYNMLMWPDEDEEESLTGDGRLYLILGKDDETGEIRKIRVTGAWADALSFFGLEDAPNKISDISKGKMSVGKAAGESGKAFANKMFGGSMPIEKTFLETTIGWTLYPDVFEPRPIRDKGEHISRMFAADKVYNLAKGKPTRSAGDELLNFVSYKSNPGEAAYFKIRSKMYDFLDEKGIEKPSATPTKRSNLLYYYRQSIKMGDEEAAQEWYNKYIEAGGTDKAIRSSIKNGEALSVIPKKLRTEFLETLDEQDLKLLDMADEWYDNIYNK